MPTRYRLSIRQTPDAQWEDIPSLDDADHYPTMQLAACQADAIRQMCPAIEIQIVPIVVGPPPLLTWRPFLGLRKLVGGK